MRDEALLHFHDGVAIAPGIHLRLQGAGMEALLTQAMPYLDPTSPGRCVAGFCAVHSHLVENITAPPPPDWRRWNFARWDSWFGRLHGVFLADMAALEVVQYPLWSCGANVVACDFSNLPRRDVSNITPLPMVRRA